jgi:hypothetical protein
MSIKSEIIDGWGSGQKACVSTRGELVVGKVDYSTSYAIEATAAATAYNFVGPISAKRFVITDILLYANKNVGAGDASVQVYEADSSTSTTITKTILDIEMVKQTARDMTGLNLIVTEGKWVNIKTDDATIFASVMGYYVRA